MSLTQWGVWKVWCKIFGAVLAPVAGMQALLRHWTDVLLDLVGIESTHHEGWSRFAAFLLVLFIAFVFDFAVRLGCVTLARRIVRRTHVIWDDELFNAKVIGAACHVLTALLLTGVLPVVFDDKTEVRVVVLKAMQIFLVLTIYWLVDTSLHAAFRIISLQPRWQNRPINGLRQTGQGFAAMIGVVMIVSIVVDKSPVRFFTGLGASAAVLMLVFRDSILGFVSGIQLSSNDMVRVGDWISVPKYGANGRVEEVSLNTVKIRNWDNSVSTLPPYLLVSESFVNWHAMQLSGGRRVTRSLFIDMTSIRCCTPAMRERFSKMELLKEYCEGTDADCDFISASMGVGEQGVDIGPQTDTNIGWFRLYMFIYLRKMTAVNHDMSVIVRLDAPSSEGLPMELYFFTRSVVWTEYEAVQAAVLSHMIAKVGDFGLRVFQSPSGYDLAGYVARPYDDPPHDPL